MGGKGVTVPSIDAMLAEIDRALAPAFRLPAGGPVQEQWVRCWGETPLLRGGAAWAAACTKSAGLRDNGLCEKHHLAIVGTDADRDARIAAP